MDLMRHVWASVRGCLGSSSTLESRLLPNNHWVVAKMQEARQKQWAPAKASGFSGGKSGKCKWRQRHDRWAERASKTRTKGTNACTADDLFLHLPRERDVWKKLTQAGGEEAHSIVCDLSQSLAAIESGWMESFQQYVQDPKSLLVHWEELWLQQKQSCCTASHCI